MHSDKVVYYALLASESSEYCCQALKEWTSDQLLGSIHLAHSLVDQGYMPFGDVQPLIQMCAELA